MGDRRLLVILRRPSARAVSLVNSTSHEEVQEDHTSSDQTQSSLIVRNES
jgi:hypothetical protein